MKQLYTQLGYIAITGNNSWTIMRPFGVRTRIGLVVIHEGFEFDKDSVVRNSPDWIPSCIHDYLYVYQRAWSGYRMSRKTADLIYRDLNEASHERYNRRRARIRYWGVRLGGYWAWNRKGKPHAIPRDVRHYYPPIACDIPAITIV